VFKRKRPDREGKQPTGRAWIALGSDPWSRNNIGPVEALEQ
jgi:hypothetical protein